MLRFTNYKAETMRDKKYEVGVIFSSLSLAENFKKIAQERGQNVHTALKALNHAVDVGKRMQADGVEVIICGRGTANMLRKDLSIPVISNQQPLVDVIKSLKKASQFSKKIILTTFEDKLRAKQIDWLYARSLEAIFSFRILLWSKAR